jgi:allophanate hydrolase
MSTTERSILPGIRSIPALPARHATGDLTPHAPVASFAAHFTAGDPHHAWIRPLMHAGIREPRIATNVRSCGAPGMRATGT